VAGVWVEGVGLLILGEESMTNGFYLRMVALETGDVLTLRTYVPAILDAAVG
jgi:hypothetical protein